ncbi:hypothetical protein [Peribacillus simplex]|uniref:hypothetical protein n=1 Tax=Peribacillus simplex TaxID=1478 RepID=UPI0024C1410E|nr:hypothetical protein [Peribacillus simplex]WHX89888.1 hypothetical protein QNH50_17845 [Peribacillus simplex]
MNRRNLLRNMLIFIFAFFFGFTVKKEGENMILQKNDSKMRGKDIQSIVDEINVLKEQSKETSKQINGVINSKQFGVIGDGKVGDSDSIQSMIDSCRQSTLSSTLTKQYTLEFPSGKYIIDKEIKMSPFVKIKPIGYVEFCVTHNGTGFHITPNSDDPIYNNFGNTPGHLAKNSWNRGKYFDGSNGAVVFTTTINNDDPLTKTIAIELGSRDPNSGKNNPISRYVLENVNIYDFDVAIKNNAVNNYLGTYKNCHLELNNHAVTFKTPVSGKQINSGENFLFDNCIIAGSKKEAILVDVMGHDITFENCSFDYNSSPVFKSLSSGTSIRLNNCYLEKIGDGIKGQLIYQAESHRSGETNGHNSFYIKNLITFLKRPTELFKNVPNSNKGYINLYLDIDGLELRYEVNKPSFHNSINDRFLVNSPKVFVMSKKILNMSTLRSLVTKDLNLLSNSDFNLSTIDADLTELTNDSYWFVAERKGVSNPIIKKEGLSKSKCLKYTITNSENYVKLENKFMYNVEAGETLLMSALVKLDKVSKKTDINFSLECYDANTTLIQTLTYNDRLNFDVGSGVKVGSFRLFHSVGSFYIPNGVFKLKPILIVVNTDSKVIFIDDIHLVKSK